AVPLSDAAFHPSGKELLTSGPQGLYRWPFRAQSGSVQIGPPVKVLGRSGHWLVLDREGRKLAVLKDGAALVVNLERPSDEPLRLSHSPFFTTMSPDGNWVVTSSEEGGFKIWDTRAGKLVRHLRPGQAAAVVAFSGDGHWLVTNAVPADDHKRGKC